MKREAKARIGMLVSLLLIAGITAGSVPTQVLAEPEAGTVIASFASPGTAPSGLAWDGQYLWCADWDEDKIYKLTTSGGVVTSFSAPESEPFGLAWDGQYLWCADRNTNKIYKLTTSGGVVTSFSAPGWSVTGLAWDGQYLWSTDDVTDETYKLTTSGDVITSFFNPLPGPCIAPSGLAWDGQYLWYTDFVPGEIYELTTSGDLITSFSSPGPGPSGLAWDGQYLWNADSATDTIYKIDVGPITTGSISGTISYSGAQTGPISVFVRDYPSITGDSVAYTIIPIPGAYSVTGIPEGTYTVIAGMDTDQDDLYGEMDEPLGAYDAFGPVTVTAGQVTSNIDITLKDPGSISGTISYTGTQTGKIYGRAFLDPSLTGPSSPLFLISDAPGSYSVVVPSFTFYLTAFMDSNGNGQYDSTEPYGIHGVPDPVTVNPNTDTPHVDITLVAPSLTGTISGKVTDPAGVGIYKATVSTNGHSTTTEEDGNYSLSVPEGKYSVTASVFAYETQTETNVTVTGGKTTPVNFSLTPTGLPVSYIKKYAPTLIFDSGEKYFPVHIHGDDYDVTNNHHPPLSGKLGEGNVCYYHVSDQYPDFYVIQYWYYYPYNDYLLVKKYITITIPVTGQEITVPVVFDQFVHQHDFEVVFVWVNKSTGKVILYYSSCHLWHNGPYTSEGIGLYVEKDGHGMSQTGFNDDLNPYQLFICDGGGETLGPVDFYFLPLDSLTIYEDIDLDNERFKVSPGENPFGGEQGKAPWLQNRYKHPDEKFSKIIKTPFITVKIYFTPVELRVYDSNGNVTGLVDGKIKKEILDSDYYEGVVVIPAASDSYTYEVVATDQGTYGLYVIFTKEASEKETEGFYAIDIPTTTGAVHQYTIDWDALSRGEEGVTVQMDNDGDGEFELTFTTGATLVSMSSFVIDYAKIDFKKKPDDDKVRVSGNLELNLVNGDGVDISEDVTVTVGPLSETIKMVEKGKKGEKWEYKRPKGGEGNIKKMTINWKKGEFDIRMDRADLTGITNPVTISIQIQDDFGQETITMTVKKDKWEYKRPKGSDASIVEESIAPPKFGLSQNYPNPCNPETTIEYGLAESCHVTLKIYNIAGQLIKTLVDEYQTQGRHTITWYGDTDAGGEVASGIYFYRIKAGDFVSTKKMVVLK